MESDSALLARMEAVWKLKPPGPDQLLQHPAFLALADYCRPRYGGGERLAFSLHQVLLSIGLPCRLGDRHDLAPTVADAGVLLHQALTLKSRTIRYLVPLDMGDTLPPLVFGACRLQRFSADELAVLFDASRLARLYPTLPLDTKRLSQFHWLVVEDERDVDPRPEARAMPWMFESLAGDFGAIDPHRSEHPAVVERALFHILTAPWEEWVSHADLDWRAFHVPWVYVLDADPCVRPRRPPDPDTLSWRPWFVDDGWGNEIELERPNELPIDEDQAAKAPTLLNGVTWQATLDALDGPLFETPVLHFFVHAFLTDGIDEFMAHLTTIEAALGLEADHFAKLRQEPDPKPKLKSTARIVARIAALLNDVPTAREFGTLFNLRSAFVHGRKSGGMISSEHRVMARSLTRRVVTALIAVPRVVGQTREQCLYDLLCRGAPMI